MSHRSVVLLVCLCCGCATTGPLHGRGESVSWSMGKADSPRGGTTEVCASAKPGPCILERSTTERAAYARFSIHVFGPKSSTFRGTVLFTYLDDPDPTHYKSDVNLTSDNQEVHQHNFSRVTTNPGGYSVRVHLEETGPASLQPRAHDFMIPVTVR